MKYKVGDAIVDLDANRVERADGVVDLEPRVGEVLGYLIRHSGQLVSRDMLLDAVWGTRNVSDDVVTRCINVLRRTFEDDAREPRVLQTLNRRGYRLIAEIREVDHRGRPGVTALRMRPERGAFYMAATASLEPADGLVEKLHAALAVDMERRSSGEAEQRWSGRFYRAAARLVDGALILRLERRSLTLLLPVVAGALGFLITGMLLYGREIGSGHVRAGAMAGGVIAGLLAWRWKTLIDERRISDLVHRRDLIVAALLGER